MSHSYVVLAISMIVIFNLLPLLLFLSYPTKCFQHLLGCFPNVNWHPLRAFMDIFQNFYEDGTDGSRDCRYFSGLNFVVIISLLIPAFDVRLQTIFASLIYSYMILIMRPYRKSILNYWDSLVFFLYALIFLFLHIDYLQHLALAIHF